MTTKAQQHGVVDARTFANENTAEELLAAIEPGQLGADESLISAMGLAATSRFFGVEAGTDAFSTACDEYNAAWLKEARRLATEQ
jgi:hypothetical protein